MKIGHMTGQWNVQKPWNLWQFSGRVVLLVYFRSWLNPSRRNANIAIFLARCAEHLLSRYSTAILLLSKRILLRNAESTLFGMKLAHCGDLANVEQFLIACSCQRGSRLATGQHDDLLTWCAFVTAGCYFQPKSTCPPSERKLLCIRSICRWKSSSTVDCIVSILPSPLCTAHCWRSDYLSWTTASTQARLQAVFSLLKALFSAELFIYYDAGLVACVAAWLTTHSSVFWHVSVTGRHYWNCCIDTSGGKCTDRWMLNSIVNLLGVVHEFVGSRTRLQFILWPTWAMQSQSGKSCSGNFYFMMYTPDPSAAFRALQYSL